jgi:excisionase family DNA binding protein
MGKEKMAERVEENGPPRELTIHQVALLLRVPDITVRRWVNSGRLPATRVGRMLKIKRSDVERLTPYAARQRNADGEVLQPGSAAALLDAAERCSQIVQSADVEELERLIAEGCERPGEAGEVLA